MCSFISEALYFETVKLVTVRSLRLALAYRIIQLIVLAYLSVYALWYMKGYQATSKVDGTIFLKAKGVARINISDDVVDSGDLVIPEVENNALFIATRSLSTYQRANGECVDPYTPNSVPCNSPGDCKAGQSTDNGYVVPNSCNTTFNYCNVQAWCPIENDTLLFEDYNGIEQFTVFIRVQVQYTDFQVSANNANKTTPGYNLFNVSDMLAGQNISEIRDGGAIISVLIDWTCDLDVQKCEPHFKFSRVDPLPNVSSSSGFNFRKTYYIFHENSTETKERVYTKYVGIRFIFNIVGTGGRFDVFACVITVGSSVALFSLATILTDFVLQYCHPRKKKFGEAKRQILVLERDEETPLPVEQNRSINYTNH